MVWLHLLEVMFFLAFSECCSFPPACGALAGWCEQPGDDGPAAVAISPLTGPCSDHPAGPRPRPCPGRGSPINTPDPARPSVTLLFAHMRSETADVCGSGDVAGNRGARADIPVVSRLWYLRCLSGSPGCVWIPASMATFFILTGFHGLHVLLGTLFLDHHLAAHVERIISPTASFRFQAAAWYWHFVDVVWLCLFMSLSICFGCRARVRARVWAQPAHREREQQYDDHQRERTRAPQRYFDIGLRIAFTRASARGRETAGSDDEQQRRVPARP